MDGTRTNPKRTTEKLRGACFELFMSDLEQVRTCTKMQLGQSKSTILGKFWANIYGRDRHPPATDRTEAKNAFGQIGGQIVRATSHGTRAVSMYVQTRFQRAAFAPAITDVWAALAPGLFSPSTVTTG